MILNGFCEMMTEYVWQRKIAQRFKNIEPSNFSVSDISFFFLQGFAFLRRWGPLSPQFKLILHSNWFFWEAVEVNFESQEHQFQFETSQFSLIFDDGSSFRYFPFRAPWPVNEKNRCLVLVSLQHEMRLRQWYKKPDQGIKIACSYGGTQF